MVTIPLLIVLSLVMFMVQLAVFKSLPSPIRKLFAASLLIGVIVNFGISTVILAFTSAGLLAGIGNLAGSVLFGFYLTAYRKYRRIGSLRLEWKPVECIWHVRLFGRRSGKLKLPGIRTPHLRIDEGNPVSHWLF